jgi:hypothetical protein
MELGALSDFQADRVRQLVTGAGQDSTYRSFPGMPHTRCTGTSRSFTRGR